MKTGNATNDARAWRTLALTSVAVFMVLLDATILFVAFPSIRRSFPTVSTSNLSWILNAYTVVYAAFLVPGGQMADRIGRRSIFLRGVMIFLLGSITCGVAPTPAVIVGGRILQAVGGAMLTPASLALVLSAFPRTQWSLAVGLWAAVGAFAAAVGPSAGAALVQFAGWRWAFFINVPVGGLALLRAPHVLVESRDPDASGTPDVIGAVQLIASVGLVALGIVKTPEWGLGAGVLLALSGLIVLGWFVNRSRRQDVAVLDLSLFSIANFRYANAGTLVFGAAFAATFLGSVLFLTNVWGYDTARAGLAMTPGPLMVMVVAPIAGRLGNRFGHRALLIPGGILLGAGYVVRAFGTSPTPHYLTQWLPVVILTGFGVGLVLPSLAAASAHGLPPQRLAVGSGVNQAIRQIGSVLGVGATVALVAGAGGHGVMDAFSHLFLLLGAGGFLTALISIPIDTRPPRTTIAERYVQSGELTTSL